MSKMFLLLLEVIQHVFLSLLRRHKRPRDFLYQPIFILSVLLIVGAIDRYHGLGRNLHCLLFYLLVLPDMVGLLENLAHKQFLDKVAEKELANK